MKHFEPNAVSENKRAKLTHNNYAGYKLTSPNTPLPRLAALPDAHTFYDDYVKVRRPVVIDTKKGTDTNSFNSTSTAPWYHNFQKWSSNDYLKQVAGHSNVRVETRAQSGIAYGQGKYDTMAFSSFLDILTDGSTKPYVTTQDAEVDEQGRPAIMSSPCTELSHDFPLVPPLVGNLILANVNIWMGNSAAGTSASSASSVDMNGESVEGTSSGLHHDFHDNLYVLLRGRKRFRLFSPADAEKLHTHGVVERVHPNGRICYVNELTHADGSTEDARLSILVREEMEAATVELEAAEESVAKSEQGSAERLAEAEERMDLAMEASMNFEMGDEEDMSDDDYQGDTWNGLAMSDQGCRKEAEFEIEDAGMAFSENKITNAENTTPNHFSRIDMSIEESIRLKKWPSLRETTMTEVVLNAGDMLYLPAGWFHEVISETTAENNGHMAFNYWFHPPDGDSVTTPYSSPFWKKDWEDRGKCEGN